MKGRKRALLLAVSRVYVFYWFVSIQLIVTCLSFDQNGLRGVQELVFTPSACCAVSLHNPRGSVPPMGACGNTVLGSHCTGLVQRRAVGYVVAIVMHTDTPRCGTFKPSKTTQHAPFRLKNTLLNVSVDHAE